MRDKGTFRVLLFAMIYAALSEQSFSVEVTEPSTSDTLESSTIEQIEIIGSRLVENDFLLGRTLIDQQTLAQRRPSDLTESLSFESGIYINRPGGGGNIASLHLRGAEPNYTLVLIDGVAITDTTDSRGGTFDLAGIDPATIEKIEVIQGAALPLYGPGALSGVINIHTRKVAPGEQLFRLSAESDADDFIRLNGGAGFAINDTATLQTDVAYVDSGQLDSGGQVESLQSVSKIQFEITDHIHGKLFFRASNTEEQAFPDDSGGIRHAIYRELDTRETDQIQLAFLGGWDNQGPVSARSSISWFQQKRTEDSPGIFPGSFIPPNGAETSLDRIHWRGDVSIDLSNNISLLTGLSYEHEDGSSLGYLFAPGVVDMPFSLTRETVGGFAEVRLPVGDKTQVHGSARVDNISGFQARSSFSLGLVREISDQVRLRLGHSTGFRPPSFFALSHPLTGNSDLTIEKARTSEISLDYNSANGQFGFTTSVFNNQFENQVDFDEISFTHVNRDSLTIKGAEVKLRWRPNDRINVQINTSYMDIDIEGLDRPPRNRPDFLFSASATFTPNQAFTFTLNSQIRSEQFSSSFVTGPQYLDGYEQVDFVTIWKPREKLDFSLKLMNIFDSSIEQAVGVPSPGRSLRFGIGWSI